MNKFELQLQQTPVEQNTAISLQNTFTPFFEQAEMWKKKAKSIVVTDSSQLELIQEAREARLALKNIRVMTERKRKTMKEESLRTGRAIDGFANIIKFLCVPIEEHLQEQEDFAKRLEEQRKVELADKRIKELSQYDVDVSFYNLAEMDEQGYIQLLNNSKIAYETQKAELLKVEKDRIFREKTEREEQERIRKENEKLKLEAKEREKAEEKRQEKEQTEREAHEKAIAVEREKREKIEAKLREQKREKERAEGEEKQRIEKEQRAQAEAKKEARLAPDKKKLQLLAVTIAEIEFPEVMSNEAKEVLKITVEKLNAVVSYLKEQSIK